MLSYRMLKIGNVGQPVILVHVTLFSLSWSFTLQKKMKMVSDFWISFFDHETFNSCVPELEEST
jgi:hypothetical protein